MTSLIRQTWFYYLLEFDHHKLIYLDIFHGKTPRQKHQWKIRTEKNEIVSYVLQRMRRKKNITVKRLHLIKSTINILTLLDYIHIRTYNWINDKCPRFPIINFYILIQFNIWIFFSPACLLGYPIQFSL